MSIESFSPLPLNVCSGWLPLLDPSDVPLGMSPSLGDVSFFPGGVRTRPGLVSQFPVLAGAPQVNGLKTYITPNLIQRLLVLDSDGNLYMEVSPGVLSVLVAGGAKPNLYLASNTLFGREYMAFGDGITGQDLPRQFDDQYFDRVSQIGPAEGPAVVDSSSAGNISPGVHQCVVIFVTPTTAVPNGSAAVTGLAAGTTYHFYPYWDEGASVLAWVPGGAGSTGYAQSAKTNSAAQQQGLQGHIPLSRWSRQRPRAARAEALEEAAEAVCVRARSC